MGASTYPLNSFIEKGFVKQSVFYSVPKNALKYVLSQRNTVKRTYILKYTACFIFLNILRQGKCDSA